MTIGMEIDMEQGMETIKYHDGNAWKYKWKWE